MHNLIEQHLGDIHSLCSKHKVKHLFVFGSVLSDRFNGKSDIDLIVDFDSMEIAQYADNYFDFKFSLQDIFQRPVDLLEEKALTNPYFLQVVNKQKRLIYEH